MELVALLISTLLVASAAFNAAGAVEYEVTNNAVGTDGGNVFDRELGVDYSKQVLADASAFVWTTFQQYSETDRRNVQLITLSIENFNQDNVDVAVTSQDNIRYNARYITGSGNDLKRGFEGVLYHEVTHVWQWNGNNEAPAPSWVIEGVADFVRLKAGYVPSDWAKPGEGKKWDEGYSVTARFFDYCNDLKDGFVAQLNAKMRDGYSDDFFAELLGKPLDQLWNDYKAQHGS